MMGFAGKPGRLTAQQIQEIRDWYDAVQSMPRRYHIAKKYGVTEAMISLIGARKAYKWVGRRCV